MQHLMHVLALLSDKNPFFWMTSFLRILNGHWVRGSCSLQGRTVQHRQELRCDKYLLMFEHFNDNNDLYYIQNDIAYNTCNCLPLIRMGVSA